MPKSGSTPLMNEFPDTSSLVQRGGAKPPILWVFGSARGLWVKFKVEEKIKICVIKIQDGRQTRVYSKASTRFAAC